MTDEELKAIEAHVAVVDGFTSRDFRSPAEWSARVEELRDDLEVEAQLSRLVAEVRRLRGLVKLLEWGSCDNCGNRTYCTECGGSKYDGDDFKGRHADDCPAFTPDGRVR